MKEKNYIVINIMISQLIKYLEQNKVAFDKEFKACLQRLDKAERDNNNCLLSLARYQGKDTLMEIEIRGQIAGNIRIKKLLEERIKELDILIEDNNNALNEAILDEEEELQNIWIAEIV